MCQPAAQKSIKIKTEQPRRAVVTKSIGRLPLLGNLKLDNLHANHDANYDAAASTDAKWQNLLRSAALFLLSKEACIENTDRDGAMYSGNNDGPSSFVLNTGPKPEECVDDACDYVKTYDIVKNQLGDHVYDRPERYNFQFNPNCVANYTRQLFKNLQTADPFSDDQFYLKFFERSDLDWSSSRGYILVVASKGEEGKVDVSHPGHLVVAIEDPIQDADVDQKDVRRKLFSMGFFPTGQKVDPLGFRHVGRLNFPDNMLHAWIGSDKDHENYLKRSTVEGALPIRVVKIFQPSLDDVVYFRSIVRQSVKQASSRSGADYEEEYPTTLFIKTRWALLAGVVKYFTYLSDKTHNCATFFENRFDLICMFGAPFLCTTRKDFKHTVNSILLKIRYLKPPMLS
jgi:hypothetical protein